MSPTILLLSTSVHFWPVEMNGVMDSKTFWSVALHQRATTTSHANMYSIYTSAVTHNHLFLKFRPSVFLPATFSLLLTLHQHTSIPQEPPSFFFSSTLQITEQSDSFSRGNVSLVLIGSRIEMDRREKEKKKGKKNLNVRSLGLRPQLPL